MLIYLDQYRQARSSLAHNAMGESGLMNGTDGSAVVNAVHMPAQLYAVNIPAQTTLSPELPDDLANIDVESFLNRIYALASQV